MTNSNPPSRPDGADSVDRLVTLVSDLFVELDVELTLDRLSIVTVAIMNIRQWISDGIGDRESTNDGRNKVAEIRNETRQEIRNNLGVNKGDV